MSHLGEPTEPWLSPDPSQPPDPAAYLHATYPAMGEPPTAPPLYPAGPSMPPPPATSAPVYFSMLTTKDPRKGQRGMGILVGIVLGVLLATALSVAAIRGGVFTTSSPRGALPPATSTTGPTLGTPHPTQTSLPGAANPTPGANPVGTATPLATGTPLPGATPSPTTTTSLVVNVGCLALADKHSAQFCVHTAANASLGITVTYCDGPQDTNVDTSGTTDTSGQYSISWKPSHIPQNCDTAIVSVAASVGNQRGTGTGTLPFTCNGQCGGSVVAPSLRSW